MNTPKAHILNLTCELEVANGAHSYTAPGYLRKFTQDLEALPLVYASPEDYVLVENIPSADFQKRLTDAGFQLPQFITFNHISKAQGCTPTPWGHSPASAFRLKQLDCKWNEELRPFFSRQYALEISQRLQNKSLTRIIDKAQIAYATDSLSTIEKQLFEWGKIVIKAPYSSSGRGVQMLRANHLNTSIINKTRSIIKQQGSVMIEPLLDVLCDFAFEFEMIDGKVNFIGYSSFVTNENGQYAGHQIPFSTDNIPTEAQKLWDIGVVNSALEELKTSLEESDLTQYFSGYFGVDAFIFKNHEGKAKLQPCLEINLRNNMGIVALHIEKHLAIGSECIYRIEQNGPVSLELFDLDLQNTHPLVIENGKIVSGYLPLTPPTCNATSMAYIIATKS